MNKSGSRKLYQIQISEKYEKPTLQLHYERYFNKFDFDWKLIYCLPHMVTVDTKLRVFQYKILNNILFVNKMLFKIRKVESAMCSFYKAEDETYIYHFYRCRNSSILWRQLQGFFSTALNLPSILPQSAIFSFPDDALEHKLLINNILLIFNLNFKILKNYLTKMRDLEANLKANDKYNKKWAVISNIAMFHKKIMKTKGSKRCYN